MNPKQLVFIDDSGDPGFKKSASSANLVMAAVVFNNPKIAATIDKQIEYYRSSLGWSEKHEFKFNKAPKNIKINFLKLVNTYDFNIYAVYINKQKWDNFSGLLDKEKLYNWTMKGLLDIMPLDRATVKADGRSDKQSRRIISTYIRKEARDSVRKIKIFKLQDSSKDNLIQMADMIAGSINRSFQADKTDSQLYISIIKRKIIKLKELNLN